MPCQVMSPSAMILINKENRDWVYEKLFEFIRLTLRMYKCPASSPLGFACGSHRTFAWLVIWRSKSCAVVIGEFTTHVGNSREHASHIGRCNKQLRRRCIIVTSLGQLKVTRTINITLSDGRDSTLWVTIAAGVRSRVLVDIASNDSVVSDPQSGGLVEVQRCGTYSITYDNEVSDWFS